ncbi:MAG: FtsX-like permease family protein, partial [Gemmatimonadales bacterium]|nr:FtsX-like permease family protein [Gemmatimonadales bacterium]
LMLVGVQAALSGALLVASVGFVSSFRRATSFDLGYDMQGVLVGRVSLFSAGYSQLESRQFYLRAHERIRTLPGVVSASLGYTGPWNNNRNEAMHEPGRDSLPTAPLFGAPNFDAVTPDYLATMGLRLQVGRWIEESDGAGNAPIMVVNEALTKLYWPGQPALGRCLRIGNESMPCRTIVGVVANHRFTGGLEDDPVAGYFLPLAQSDAYTFTPQLFVQVRGDPLALVSELRRQLQGMAPNLPAATVFPLASNFEPLIASWRLGAMAFSGFGIVAGLVAMVGLFSVLAYLVTERTREFAIRSALGAQPAQVARPVIRQGVMVTATGLAAGLGLTAFAARWLQPMLFQTKLTDPLAVGSVCAALLAMAFLASLGPARRAAGKDPMEALRSQ